LSEDDKNKSDNETLLTAYTAELGPIEMYTPAETTKGKKHRENNERIYKMVATDLLYFAKSIPGRPIFWAGSHTLTLCW